VKKNKANTDMMKEQIFFDEMFQAFHWTNMLSWIYIMFALLKQQFSDRYVPPLGQIIRCRDNQSYFLMLHA